MDTTDIRQLSGLSDALENAESLFQNYNAQVSAQSAPETLPSLTELETMMSGNFPGTQLAGGRRAKSGGSKKSRKSTSSRSKRAELRQRYKLSPRKRGRRRKTVKK